MLSCPSCGRDNPPGFAFCGYCTTPLDGPVRPQTGERKVVTVLFCDLVSFSARSDRMDPEDVRAFLLPYYEVLTSEIARHGGTIDKFTGDGVMAVFGAPIGHEDDPERAVRAGLRILDQIPDLGLDLHARIGVNTGEVVVLPGTFDDGDAITGDAANTAARLQVAAPIDAIVVGEATYSATAQLFDYRALESVAVKGRAEPLAIFQPTAPLSRYGADPARMRDTPFIGREIDLGMLKGVFDKSRASSSVQLVTVAGEPGIGKSRLVAELFAYIDEIPDLTTWRQGRCLPYGEGITFWALGEVVKAHAGILESDPPEVAAAKLEVVLPRGSEREWFRQRLLPLLGIAAKSTAEQEELFTAWRRFFEHIAEQDPTVLVFEDLHWADAPMLEFLEHLADRAEGVPLMIVGTARPELFEGHPDYARGLRNNTPINLDPLSQTETTRLVAALLETSVIPAELQTPILERSGGNPLYAEEFIRLLKDKELLIRKGSSWELSPGAEIPFPDSVQALIAARLDTLPPERKSMLADAAVIGKVFWAGGVATMGDLDESEVVEALHELSRKELVRPVRRSSMEGEGEYAFCHVLARDVAYAQLPRTSRASRHVAAASWIESKAPERLEDLAEVLAYHYTSALELARAVGQTEQAVDLEAPALRFLMLGGHRALGLDIGSSLDAFERALALTPEGHPRRPDALAGFGEAALNAARYSDAEAALGEAITAFKARGEILAAARAMGVLSRTLAKLNDPRLNEVRQAALELLEPLPPGPELIDALADVSYSATVADGNPHEGIALADRAMEIAAALGLPRPARALGYRGSARCLLGDIGGLEDQRQALSIATDAGQGRVAGIIWNNLGIDRRNFEGPRAALETFSEGLAFAEGRGLKDVSVSIRSSALTAMVAAGELEEVLAAATELAEHAEAVGDEFDLGEIRSAQAVAFTLRGRAREAEGSLDQLVAASRRSGDPDSITQGFGAAVIVLGALGEAEAVAALLVEMESTPRLGESSELAWFLSALVDISIQVGKRELAERLVGRLAPRYPYAEHALVSANAALAEAKGEFETAAKAHAEAATRWEDFGDVPEQGYALLSHGRCLLKLFRAGDSTEVLQQALWIFTRCGMHPALEETEALLAKAAALSP